MAAAKEKEEEEQQQSEKSNDESKQDDNQANTCDAEDKVEMIDSLRSPPVERIGNK